MHASQRLPPCPGLSSHSQCCLSAHPILSRTHRVCTKARRTKEAFAVQRPSNPGPPWWTDPGLRIGCRSRTGEPESDESESEKARLFRSNTEHYCISDVRYARYASMHPKDSLTALEQSQATYKARQTRGENPALTVPTRARVRPSWRVDFALGPADAFIVSRQRRPLTRARACEVLSQRRKEGRKKTHSRAAH